jgi:(1->4)-alpha-D-glucan 1-alpha-D-glucosylmutase
MAGWKRILANRHPTFGAIRVLRWLRSPNFNIPALRTQREKLTEPSDLKACIDQMLQTDARVPVSTYRTQMFSGFTFADAEAILPYLKELGIGDFYASPIFEARPGSTHGYDVARHDRLNPELGGDEGFERFASALHEAEMGLLLDIVPNHMGVGNDSLWWQDVLENGRASRYAEYFDVDWTPLKPDMQGKLLLPILGKQYGEELESKHFQVSIENGHAIVRYFDHTMPLAPRPLAILFPEEEWDELGVSEPLRQILRELPHIPPHDTADPSLAALRREELTVLRPRLIEELKSEAMQPAITKAVERINGKEGDPKSFDRLHALLEAQPYRLALWRVSSEEINYRRFFDVNDLVGLRMENAEVFAETHSLIRKLLARRQVTGLRIDHADGMFNPRQYLIRLQLLAIAALCAGETPIGPTAPTGIELSIREAMRGYDWAKSQGPLYTVVEKILEPKESLPREWPVRGTSGYDFVYFSNEIFVQQKNESRFNALYESVIGDKLNPDDVIYRSKLKVMQASLASEVYVLTNLLSKIAAANRRVRDFTDNILEDVIRETIACFPVYRTYIDDRGQYTERDRTVIEQAVRRAKRLNPELDASAFDFLRNTLLLGDRKQSGDEPVDPRTLYFALKFQQLTGPVMAKGVEDTSFYVYNRFISSNEVGGSIKAFGISLETFHASNYDRLRNSPDATLTTSTHDTKRSEDLRSRLNVLSEMPLEWASLVRRWQRMNARFKRTLDDGRVAPDPNEEYLLYQTIVGAWPWQEGTDNRKKYLERLQQYAAKALSEAKTNMSWINPDSAYLEAVQGFLADILTPGIRGKETRFVETLESILPVLRLFGGINALSQVVLKTTSPGVPDFYQGTELWDLSLVDPDNRRPVNYAVRKRLLSELILSAQNIGPRQLCAELLESFPDGRIKLWTTHRALQIRRQHHEIFRRGAYVPLNIEAEKASNAVVFLRSKEGKSVLTVAPRFACTLMRCKPVLPLGDVWGNASITLPAAASTTFTNGFTGEKITAGPNRSLQLRDVLAHFPVAMLVSEETKAAS